MSNFPWNRFVMPLQQWVDATGVPLGGGKLYFFETGTSTPLDTYSDQALTIPNTNPVVADQSGVFGPIFLQNQSYKVMLTDSNGDVLWVEDPVSPYVATSPSSTPTAGLAFSVDGGGVVPGTGIVRDGYIPWNCTITASVLQAITDGSLQLDIWVAPFTVGSPPTVANSIVASAPPTLTAANSSYDSTLTGWTKNIAAGSWIRYSITSIDVLTSFTHTLVVTKT